MKKGKKEATYPEMLPFAKRLKGLREEKDWSQMEFGAQLGGDDTPVSSATVSAWENANKRPTVDTLMKIAKLFGVSMDYLLGLEDKREKTIDVCEAVKALEDYAACNLANGDGETAEVALDVDFLSYLTERSRAAKSFLSMHLSRDLYQAMIDHIDKHYRKRFSKKLGLDSEPIVIYSLNRCEYYDTKEEFLLKNRAWDTINMVAKAIDGRE